MANPKTTQKRIRDLHIGDLVKDVDGKYRPVTKHQIVGRVHVIVRLSDGRDEIRGRDEEVTVREKQ